ncbi:MAG: trehalose-phosphatase [Candidatus Omnitrophica bacterium]|nr:trehalose-phosphatase [Candidatus Omnitrophota bacterium]
MHYLFDEWGDIKKRARGRSLFIFLDFDGTLTPIVKTPDKAELSAKFRTLLGKIAESQNLKLAFISGRGLADIKNKIGIKNAIYSGNHGLEIEGPKIKFSLFSLPGYRKTLERIKNDLKQNISSVRGIFVEDKGLSLSLHYRQAEKKLIPRIKTIFHETVISYLAGNKIKVRSGKMVLEIRPPVEWDKGRVVLWLLARQIFAAKKEDVLPVYIGDDVTDEDAFKALRNKGLTIFVGKPKESYARYYLKSPNEVMRFLRDISGA